MHIYYKEQLVDAVSSLLALQPCYVSPSLLHGFVAVSFSGVGSFAPRPTPQPGGPGTTLRLTPSF
jgi:hypothetical protein